MPIKITNLSGNFTRDTDTFNKMDPYLEINIGAETRKSTIQNGAGKTPKWPDIMTFNTPGNILKVVVKDEDIGTDDLVGEGHFDISQAYTHANQPGTFSVEIFYQGKSAGSITLTLKYEP